MANDGCICGSRIERRPYLALRPRMIVTTLHLVKPAEILRLEIGLFCGVMTATLLRPWTMASPWLALLTPQTPVTALA
jgi:hypothetical protein